MSSPEPTSPSVRAASGGDSTPLPPRCLDCGAEVLGPHCHRCGQRHRSPLRPLRDLLATALRETVDLDGRLPRTLWLLFRRPGALTVAWIRGRRSRHTSPVRLYLLASVVYFGVLSLTEAQTFLAVFTITGDGAGFDAFLDVVPKLMVLLLPFFALLLAGLYRSRERLYVEHLVFGLHYHTFLFLLFPVEAVLSPLSDSSGPVGVSVRLVVAAVPVYMVAHLVLALRRVYGGGVLATVGRSLALWMVYALALGLGGSLATEPLRRVLLRQLLAG